MYWYCTSVCNIVLANFQNFEIDCLVILSLYSHFYYYWTLFEHPLRKQPRNKSFNQARIKMTIGNRLALYTRWSFENIYTHHMKSFNSFENNIWCLLISLCHCKLTYIYIFLNIFNNLLSIILFWYKKISNFERIVRT